MATTLTLPLPKGFSFPRAVCSYGFFVLAPNRWRPTEQVLERPLRAGDRVVRAALDQRGDRLRARLDGPLARRDHAGVKAQIARMLRLDTDPAVFERFHAVCPEAADAGFGRLFRSPTLFEDMVKTITGCNVGWSQTTRMNRLLCARFGPDGAFPTPAELAPRRPETVKRHARVGYRAERIVRLAVRLERGELDPAWFESPDREADELERGLRAIHGIGAYAARNMLAMLGRFDRLAVDTETLRHMRREHGATGSDAEVAEAARRRYAAYRPFDFLAYWFELWRAYERELGPAIAWRPEDGGRVTAAAR